MPDQKYSDNRSYPAIPFFEVDDGDGVKMEPLDYWRLCDELSVVQAALLIVGVDPSEFMNRVEYMGLETRPEGYEAAKAAICGALRCNNVTGKIARIHNSKTFRSEYIEDEDSIDLEKTRLQVGSLKTWLAARGIKTGFFFAEGSESPDYLDPSHPRYAPKLAAAVLAWQATGDEAALKGKSPKQALVKWLREHAADFALTDDEGKPTEMGIDETAKVANWQPTGGAPKTPSENSPTPKPMLKPIF